MRTSVALNALFPGVRQGVLAATLIRPGKWWYLSELANFLNMRPSSLQRELAALVKSGILEQRRDGRRTYFKAETRSPLFCDLRGIFEKLPGWFLLCKLCYGLSMAKLSARLCMAQLRAAKNARPVMPT
jgi:DNA-binding transcriptional ArsR family regulator